MSRIVGPVINNGLEEFFRLLGNIHSPQAVALLKELRPQPSPQDLPA